MNYRLLLGSLLLTSTLLAGCAGNTSKSESQQTNLRPLLGNPELPYQPDREPQVGDILHMPTGLWVDQSQMLQAVGDQRLVYIGETHDSPAAHRFQLEVIKALAERYPGQVAIGMEVFIPAQQAALDQWVAGELSEPEFLRASDWYNIWRSDFAHYRDILEFARDNRIPVRGLNADKALVRAVGSNPPDKMEPEQRQQLPDMSFIDDYQQSMVEAVYSGHGPAGNHVEGFKRVQTLWDQTMAENIVKYLNSPEGEGKHMVVIAGGHHIRYGYGIPRRVFRLLPSSYTIIGTREIVIPDEKQHQLMDIDMPHFPMPAYDFVKHVAYEVLPMRGVKLGVMFEPTEGGLMINKVMPDSNAAAAGMLDGDLLTHLDNQQLKDMYDIKHLLEQKQKGDSASLRIQRQDQAMELDVTFSK